MTARPEALRVLAWDHPRALGPLAAAATAWAERGGCRVVVERRSLDAFGDSVPSAGAADIVLIDHPHVGAAAAAGAIEPWDGHLDAGALAALIDGAVGPSGSSYVHDGATWAIPADAACQAAAVRRGAVAPATLDDLAALLADAPGRVAVPLHPAHALSTFLTLAATLGARDVEAAFSDLAIAEAALEPLLAIAAAGPRGAFDWEPPEALAELAAGRLDCVPFSYCYVGYDVDWASAPAATGPARPLLGGVGMALLGGCARPDEAARFAAWYASEEVQSGLVLAHGGQPAAASAWTAAADPLFGALLPSIGRAVVRPRERWWPDLQITAGRDLRDALLDGLPATRIARRLHDRYLDHAGMVRP